MLKTEKLVRVDQLGSYFFFPCKSCAQLPANSPDSLALPHPGAQEKGEGGRRGEAIKKGPSSFLALRATGKEGEERDHTHTYGKQLSPLPSNYPCAQNRKEGRKEETCCTTTPVLLNSTHLLRCWMERFRLIFAGRQSRDIARYARTIA